MICSVFHEAKSTNSSCTDQMQVDDVVPLSVSVVDPELIKGGATGTHKVHVKILTMSTKVLNHTPDRS